MNYCTGEKMNPLKIVYKKTSELLPYLCNSKQHPATQIKKIAASIKEFGFNNPVLIDAENTIIAGHGRVAAAEFLKLDEVPAVYIDHLSKAQKKAFIIADNKLSMMTDFDLEILNAELEQLKEMDFDLELTGFDLEDLNFEEEVQKFETDEDSIPEIVQEPTAKLGDIWILGCHRLFCGDSTKKDDIEKLMNNEKADMIFTDPPYDLEDTYSKLIVDQAKDSCHIFFMNSEKYLIENIFNNKEFFRKMYAVDFRLARLVSNNQAMTRVDFVAEFLKGKGKFQNINDGFTTLIKCAKIHNNNEEQNWGFNQAKKVELPETFILHHTVTNDLVCDFFGGAGSTLIACEKNNRRCNTLEFDALNVDRIIRRWQEFTGKDAILDKTSETYNDLKKP